MIIFFYSHSPSCAPKPASSDDGPAWSKVLITSQLDTNLIMKENNSLLKENNSLLKELIKAIKEKNYPISMENVAVDPLPSRPLATCQNSKSTSNIHQTSGIVSYVA